MDTPYNLQCVCIPVHTCSGFIHSGGGLNHTIGHIVTSLIQLGLMRENVEEIRTELQVGTHCRPYLIRYSCGDTPTTSFITEEM